MAAHDTLLLNTGYQPIRVISWRRALCMSLLGKVEVLDSHGWLIHSVSRAFPAPAVVRLLNQARHGPLRVRFCRKNVYLRDGHCCQYCGIRFAPRELTLDHVVPRAHGGRTTWQNVVTACVPCNRRKGGRTPEGAGFLLRTKPHRPKWIAPTALRLWYEDIPRAWLDYLGGG